MKLKHLIAAAIALMPLAAHAAVLKFNFEGFVESTNDGANIDVPAIGDLNVDDLVTGSFHLDTSQFTGAAGATGTNTIANAVSNFILTIDGFTYSAPGLGGASLRNDFTAGSGITRDLFIATSGAASGPTQGGLAPSYLQFSLGGSDAFLAGSLSGLDVPTIPEFQSLFANDNNNGNTKFLTFTDGSDVRYDVTSLSIAAVPLPASSLLLLAGVGGFGLMRRKKG